MNQQTKVAGKKVFVTSSDLFSCTENGAQNSFTIAENANQRRPGCQPVRIWTHVFEIKFIFITYLHFIFSFIFIIAYLDSRSLLYSFVQFDSPAECRFFQRFPAVPFERNSSGHFVFSESSSSVRSQCY